MSAKTVVKFDETKALQFPIDGIFGCEEEVRTFEDRIVTGRKDYTCHQCGGPIRTGDRHRYIRQMYDGEFGVWRFCPDCCSAMIQVLYGEEDDADQAFEDRLGIFPGHPSYDMHAKLEAARAESGEKTPPLVTL